MKLSQKLFISLFAVTASVFSLSSSAFADEGGAAGAAAFTTDGGGNVTGVAVAASVGKNDASAAAFNDVGNNLNSAFALGSAGLITIDSMGDPAAAGMTGAVDADLTTAQANDLTNSATIQLGTVSEDVLVTVPGAGQANP